MQATPHGGVIVARVFPSPAKPSTRCCNPPRLCSSPSPPRFHGKTAAKKGGGIMRTVRRNSRARSPPSLTVAASATRATNVRRVPFVAAPSSTSLQAPVIADSKSGGAGGGRIASTSSADSTGGTRGSSTLPSRQVDLRQLLVSITDSNHYRSPSIHPFAPSQDL